MAAPVDGLPFPDFASSLPVADRASLVGLCDNDVRGQCVTKADEYRRFALAQLSIYNSIAPIHRLPPEILSQIFERCWTDRKSLRIGHVCRQWRSVLLSSTTGFWVKAVKRDKFSPDQHTVTYLGAVLERSAAHSVELSFSRFSESISDCLSNHAGRIVTLKVSLADASDLFALSLSLNSGMPCLRTLTIALKDGGDPDHWPWSYNREIESLSPPVLPRLTRLTAPPFLFPILAAPSLHHITLKACHRYHGYLGRLGSLECFCETLAVCSRNLLSLALMKTSFKVDNPTTSPCMVSLPALRYLQITDITDGCVAILSRLSLPKGPQIYCAVVDFVCHTRLSTIVSANPDPIHSCISATDRLEIRGSGGGVSVHCYAADTERLCLGLLHLGPHPDSDIIETFRDRAQVRKLTVSELGSMYIDAVEFRAFPHLAHLAISGETAELVLQQLALSTGPSDDGVSVLSPGLETLTVDFYFRSVRCRNREEVLGAALRNGDLAIVEADLRERCAELERVLEHRAQRGTKLAHLTLWARTGCPGGRSWSRLRGWWMGRSCSQVIVFS